MLLAALPPPRAGPLEGVPLIEFRHPAYPDAEKPLLRLEGVDGGDRRGLEYETALLACGIVTGNTWPNGWLATKDQAGAFVAIDRPQDSILREVRYYYFVGQHEPHCENPFVYGQGHYGSQTLRQVSGSSIVSSLAISTWQPASDLATNRGTPRRSDPGEKERHCLGTRCHMPYFRP